MLPTAEQIRQFLLGTVVPPVVGAVTTLLFNKLGLLATFFHLTETSVAAEVAQLVTWGVTTGLAWLTTHHVLRGTWTPAQRAAREQAPPVRST
jgi:hypothetical protein